MQMGAWGTGVFENDDAADFVAEVLGGTSLSPIETAIDRVLKVEQEYLEAPDAAQALAAAAILARFKHSGVQSGTGAPELNEWVVGIKLLPSQDLLEKARQSIKRVLTEPSELLELWSESGEFDDWKASTESLAAQL
jgi:hypothetical protein